MLCLKIFFSFYASYYCPFLMFGFGQGVDLDLVVQAYIHTPKFNKGFGLVPLCMFMLCLLFFMCLCLIHACFLRSRPLPCSCLFSFCGFVLVGLWGHFVCFVVSVPFGGLFRCNHVGEYIFVMFGLLAACLSPLCLALQVRLFHVSLYKCLITAYPSLLCDKMLSFLYACYASCHLASITCWFALM